MCMAAKRRRGPRRKRSGCPEARPSRRTCPRRLWSSVSSRTQAYSDSASSTGVSLGIMRSEEHTSELQSLMRISYAVFCLKKKQTFDRHQNLTQTDPTTIISSTYHNTHNTVLYYLHDEPHTE